MKSVRLSSRIHPPRLADSASRKFTRSPFRVRTGQVGGHLSASRGAQAGCWKVCALPAGCGKNEVAHLQSKRGAMNGRACPSKNTNRIVEEVRSAAVLVRR